MCVCINQDEAPELAESFLVNITGVELVGGLTGAAQPSVKRPGMEVAVVTIQENDDPRGVLQFSVSQVNQRKHHTTPSVHTLAMLLKYNTPFLSIVSHNTLQQ